MYDFFNKYISKCYENIKGGNFFNLLVIAILALWTFDIYYKPLRIVTIDVPFIINAFLERNNNKNLTSDEINKLIDDFSSKLTIALDKLSKKENLILVPRQAVISGGKDVTKQIKNELLGT